MYFPRLLPKILLSIWCFHWNLIILICNKILVLQLHVTINGERLRLCVCAKRLDMKSSLCTKTFLRWCYPLILSYTLYIGSKRPSLPNQLSPNSIKPGIICLQCSYFMIVDAQIYKSIHICHYKFVIMQFLEDVWILLKSLTRQRVGMIQKMLLRPLKEVRWCTFSYFHLCRKEHLNFFDVNLS